MELLLEPGHRCLVGRRMHSGLVVQGVGSRGQGLGFRVVLGGCVWHGGQAHGSQLGWTAPALT